MRGRPPKLRSWGAKGAVNVLYGKELKAIEDPAKREELAAKYRAEYSEKFESPYRGEQRHDYLVIEPAETRGATAMALRATIGKRETRLPKKHGQQFRCNNARRRKPPHNPKRIC